MTFFKIKNKPFYFLFVFIFACMATKPIVASPMKSSKPLSKEGKEVILGDKDSVYLERKKDVWRLMKCEDSSFCWEVEGMDDMDKIAHHLENLRTPIEDYCQQGKEDGLCGFFALSLEWAQRKIDQKENVTLISAGAGSVAGAAVEAGVETIASGALIAVIIIAVIIAVAMSKKKKKRSDAI